MGLPSFLKTTALAAAVSVALIACNNSSNNTPVETSSQDSNFNRVATFPICQQIDPACNTDTETVAEIVAATSDGNTLIYTDGKAENVGFVNISDPTSPTPAGTVSLSGEPTSVTVKEGYALVGVNTSADFVNTSGQLDVVDIAARNIVRSIDVGGQPDSVAASPDGNYIAVVIENERDEDLGDGRPPQAPAGYLVIVDSSDADPANWTSSTVNLENIADKFGEDPEPEYVDINSNNIAVVTMQENNYIALVDLTTGTVTNHFTAGTVDLSDIDTVEEKSLITLDSSLSSVPREPDGVTWISTTQFVTADEGDLDGGSRGFTVFNTDGSIAYTSGNTLEHLTVSLGHYPDKRSGNKGNEPENADYGKFGDKEYLFIASERSSILSVYDLADSSNPVLKQVLPTGVGPEGVLAIPSRNLLIAASEVDSRGDKIRSALNIYSLQNADAAYPTIISDTDANDKPIPWGALSGLAADPSDANTVYSVEDSFYKQSRIFTIDVSSKPAKITNAVRIKDTNDVLAALPAVAIADTSLADDDASRVVVFDSIDLDNLINDDKTVNLDPEGISVASDGGFWVASEGSGTIGDNTRPINSLNMIIKTDVNGVIEKVITLPDEANNEQVRFGFEGVAEYNGRLYVSIQRAWGTDANPIIAIYDTITEGWSGVEYPLETPTSQNGGWVGLSEIVSSNDGTFMVLERDNQGGPDAAIKRIYKVDLNNVSAGSTVTKTLVRDLMDDLNAANGLTPEKVEGLTVLANGDVLIINDNDGVDDNSGETQLINLGQL